ncbi:MAG TPA: ATP-binding protein [Lacunisphaera sp.]|jgi:PAS domain S-box-containing protein
MKSKKKYLPGKSSPPKSRATSKRPPQKPGTVRRPVAKGQKPAKIQRSSAIPANHRDLSRENSEMEAKIRELEGTIHDLNSLLRSTEIAVLFLDTRFRVRRFTPAIKDLLAVHETDIGKALSKIPRNFADRSLLKDIQQVLKKTTPRDVEVVSDSGRAYVRRALPYRTSDNRIDGVVITFVDITRLKLAETALRTSEERHRLILEGVAEYAILILDQDGRFVTWSKSAERILGYEQSEALGETLELIYTDEDRSSRTMHKELQLARDSKSITEERWHLRKDGSKFWGTGVFSALCDEGNRLYGFVKVLRDNTDRKIVEETLNKAKTDAEDANAAKDHFLANISHELRTPLSATLLWAKLLNVQQDVSPQQLKEGLIAIEKSAKEQQTLIEDLVDTSRMVAGKLRLQPKEVALVPLIQSVLEVTRSIAAEKEIEIIEALDPKVGVVRADPMRMKQVLGNLLTNAVKFTPYAGEIKVAAERIGEQIEIRVSDTGQGISKEFLSRVFDRFTQADPSGIRHTGGLGLGLSIARQLVEMHGGVISAQSDGLAKGAVFTVRLPFPEIISPENHLPAQPRKVPSLRGLQILLVEDAEETRKALIAVLTDAGAKVIAVDSAQHALEAFNRSRADLILSDIGLGKVSGHELIQQIRQWEKARKTPPVPAIALTAYADEKNRTMALASGFQQILVKPVEPLHLLTTLLALHATR